MLKINLFNIFFCISSFILLPLHFPHLLIQQYLTFYISWPISAPITPIINISVID